MAGEVVNGSGRAGIAERRVAPFFPGLPDIGPDSLVADRYRVASVLGQGGMGVVFGAWDLLLRRAVALKVMRPEARGGFGAVYRFEREAQCAAGLSSPHTIRVFDFGRDARDRLYIAMELLHGESLAERLTRRPRGLAPGEALRFVRHVALALLEAHWSGIVHRDLKPANIFLTGVLGEAERAVVLDFGTAAVRYPVPGEPPLSRPGMIVGTPAFLPPEHLRGTHVDDPRGDLYALGVVLYQCLSGRWPYEGETPVDVCVNKVNGEPVPLASRVAGLSPALHDLVEDMTRAEIEDRIGSAAEVLARIEALPDFVARRESDRSDGGGSRRRPRGRHLRVPRAEGLERRRRLSSTVRARRARRSTADPRRG